MIALWLAAGLLASSGDVPPTPDPIGGGGKFEVAAQEWEGRQGWSRKARELIAELDAQFEPEPEAVEARVATQATAPSLPPLLPSPVVLDFQRLLAIENSYALALFEAIAVRDAQAVAQAAWIAEQMLRADEEAVAALLMMELA